MTTNFKVGNYSVYTNGPYLANFEKLYKGVLVVVDKKSEDSRYVYLAIRTKKARTCIWKRACERLDRLIFDDDSFSISCDYDKAPENRSLTSLSFEEEVYEELKENIPEYMIEQGCRFSSKRTAGRLILCFDDRL